MGHARGWFSDGKRCYYVRIRQCGNSTDSFVNLIDECEKVAAGTRKKFKPALETYIKIDAHKNQEND